MRQVGLLRGINVGGRHLLPMAELRTVLAGLGAADVRTLLQSGNAVWTAPGAPLTREGVEDALQARFGFPVPMLLFAAEEFASVLAANPLVTYEPKSLHIVFLERPLPTPILSRLAERARAGEQVVAGERALYLALPDGISASKLGTELLKLQGGVVGTMRTASTAAKLLALLQSLGA
jgi:uncharacterized protein (DUF1697 family)